MYLPMYVCVLIKLCANFCQIKYWSSCHNWQKFSLLMSNFITSLHNPI